ncbi:MAG: DegT/DnrJ/EryC1/StrS family aminotransferase [Candidatus Electrothrix sp. GM3_4]|nr:DegT/DnrJ/EryC1/StrS family aminotransferase [Candidatus Electrothrix sp. GM3_4]
MNQIPVFKPLIEQEEIRAAVTSLEVGWLGMGASVGQFEEALKQYIGCESRHVVAVSTGHAALHLAMMLIKLKPDDEVITPSFNNIADFQAILAVGAKPVFCDIRTDTLCIDVNKAEKLIGPKTKAIIAMDYDCCLCDHDAVADLATSYNLRVIHDAAHSLGSYYKRKKVGNFSDICMFSFDPVKTITCIDGGALIVKTEEEVERLHQMRLIGMGQPANVMYSNQRAWTYDVSNLGFRYHMANLHAAIGLTQLAKVDKITESRQHSCTLYNKLLLSVKEVITPNSSFKNVTPFLYYIRVPQEDRQALRDHLTMRDIDTGIHWQPGHRFSLFKNCRCGDMSVTDRIADEILSLPLHSYMNESTVEYICTEIKNYFKG